MLRSGIKIYYLLFIIYWLLVIGCINSNNGKHNNDAESALKSNEYVSSNFKNYQSIYKTINDSLIFFTDSALKSFLTEYYSSWQIDSFVCLNSTNDRLVVTRNISIGACNDCLTDDVIKLLGKKINGTWYFFSGGGALTVPRDMYGKDAMHPLTFYELSQIARKEFLESALIKNDKGEYIVNDKWVDAHFYNNGFAKMGWDVIKNRAQYDSVHWFYIIDKWKHKIDTNEYKPLHSNKMNNLINSFP